MATKNRMIFFTDQLMQT